MHKMTQLNKNLETTLYRYSLLHKVKQKGSINVFFLQTENFKKFKVVPFDKIQKKYLIKKCRIVPLVSTILLKRKIVI